MELFGDWVKEEWLRWIMNRVADHKEHTFIFLTKRPENLNRWSPFPDNCWVGVSATGYWDYVSACNSLSLIKAKVKFISLEPLLSWDKYSQTFFKSCGINWLIIGQQTPTSKATTPKIEWIREIVEVADKAGVQVFLKNNLRELLPDQVPLFNKNQYELRQEFPCQQ
jgi:protein gp37